MKGSKQQQTRNDPDRLEIRLASLEDRIRQLTEELSSLRSDLIRVALVAGTEEPPPAS